MKRLMLVPVMLLFISVVAVGQQSPVFVQAGKAIRGYDPVAYFSESKPVAGKDSFSYRWNNANWYFSSQRNLELFKANPGKYAPQYGGYCAFGLSNGYKAPTDADAWTIDSGKLYLNYNLDVRKEWNKDRKARIEKADKNWPNVKDKG